MAALLSHASIPASGSWTIRQALQWADDFLQAADLADHRLSAELLLGSVLSVDRLAIFLAMERTLEETKLRLFREKVRRRAGHEPAAYLLGKKEFWSLDFEVNPRVLIPRPETELLVEEGLKILAQTSRPQTIVELGTGSGAIAVSLFKSARREWVGRMIATDLSLEAIQTARRNAFQNGLKGAISFIQGDWLFPFSKTRPFIDLLLTNPPYISEPDMAKLPQTVRKFEPQEALYGGADGLEAIRTILSQAGGLLKKGGWMLMEIGETQGKEVLTLAQDHFFNPAVLQKDYAGKDRVLKACYHG